MGSGKACHGPVGGMWVHSGTLVGGLRAGWGGHLSTPWGRGRHSLGGTPLCPRCVSSRCHTPETFFSPPWSFRGRRDKHYAATTQCGLAWSPGWPPSGQPDSRVCLYSTASGCRSQILPLSPSTSAPPPFTPSQRLSPWYMKKEPHCPGKTP